MAKSTWNTIIHGMREATDKAYKTKTRRQRNRREVQDVWTRYDDFCDETERELRDGSYTMGEYRHFDLQDNKKKRNISVLPFRDRCVQNAVKNGFEPLALRQMTDDMLGGLPERGVLAGNPRYCVVRRMQRLMADESLRYYIQGDIRKFYDNVDKVTAMRLVERFVTDRRTLSVIRQHLFKQKRLAIGDPFSHLFSNLVMSRIVRTLKQQYGKAIQIVNFADDIFIASKGKALLERVRQTMREAATALRLHYKRICIHPFPRQAADAVVFCGMKYTRSSVLICQRTKKRYVRSRHKRRSMGSYNGILEKCDTKHLRYMIEQNDNRHMTVKIRRPFAGRPMKVETMVGIRHTVVNKAEKPSRQQDTKTYWHVQALADGLGLIVYSTSSQKIVEYLATQPLPIRDLVIAHDWSGYYYEGTVYTDAEEEEMLRQQYNIH